MGKGRLEAFSDGVIAIIITIMVLELKVPHGTNDAVDMEALKALKGASEATSSVLSSSRSTGTTITTCCMRPSA